MPPNRPSDLSPVDRGREVASILGRGVIRWRRRAKAAGIVDAQKSLSGSKTRLGRAGRRFRYTG
jgi:hypothetical protein